MADTGKPVAARLQSHRRRVIVVGGSLVGLIAGNLFHRLGWEVAVFSVPLACLRVALCSLLAVAQTLASWYC